MQIYSTHHLSSESIPQSWMNTLKDMGLDKVAENGPSLSALNHIKNYSLQLTSYPIQQSNKRILINLN